jgi:hypothetical protein
MEPVALGLHLPLNVLQGNGAGLQGLKEAGLSPKATALVDQR